MCIYSVSACDSVSTHVYLLIRLVDTSWQHPGSGVHSTLRENSNSGLTILFQSATEDSNNSREIWNEK